MADMNKVKNHPGFMPFGNCANIRSSKENTQLSEEKRRDNKEK